MDIHSSPLVLRGIGTVRFEDEGRVVDNVHYQLSQARPREPFVLIIECDELADRTSLIERRLVLELADGREWHFAVDAGLNCIERAPGLVTPAALPPEAVHRKR